MRFLILFLLVPFIAQSQKTTLRILGQSNYMQYSEANVMVLNFNKETEELKKEILKRKMDSIGFKSKLEPLNNPLPEVTNMKRFEIEEENLELFEKLLNICYKLNINVAEVYFKMPPHSYSDEDKYTYLALKNAESQARIITKNLNYKIVQIINIDDETQYADPFFDFIDFDSQRGQLILNLITLLGSTDLNERKSKQPYREGGYNLWVTFEIAEN